jgi:hypothetical protein
VSRVSEVGQLEILVHTQCDNLIPEMDTVCRRGDESANTFGHVPMCVYMRFRPNESFVTKQQRKQYVSVVHCWRNNE